jgi:hypothetical protein
MAGERSDEQRRIFGDRVARAGRQVIIKTVEEFAESTGNFRLLSLLKRFEGFQSNKPMPPKCKPAKTVKAKLPEKARDFSSIVSLIDRLGRPVGTSDLGKYRRRWLEYPPRDASSGNRNRLQEVLAQMVRDEVLRATRTNQRALVYSPGPNFDAYRQESLV